jgi:hypothetical protein
MSNEKEASQEQQQQGKTKNALGYPLLQPKSPVPSDIVVSQSIVKEVGLLPLEDLVQQYVHLQCWKSTIHMR